jgi:hypothetical protein
MEGVCASHIFTFNNRYHVTTSYMTNWFHPGEAKLSQAIVSAGHTSARSGLVACQTFALVFSHSSKLAPSSCHEIATKLGRGPPADITYIQMENITAGPLLFGIQNSKIENITFNREQIR